MGPLPSRYNGKQMIAIPNRQVARLALAEAGVEYRSRSMDIGSGQEHLQPWYIRLNKSAVVPTLVYKVQEDFQ